MNKVAKKVAVVDYGMGNLRSVAQAVIHAATDTGVDVVITASPQQVLDADRVVLPGQGAMPDCMRELRESGLLASVLDAAAKKPLFGVCVGMQMLLEHSAEGDTPGLGLIAGDVRKFDLAGRMQPDGSRYKVPQMGWNQVFQSAHQGTVHPVWRGVPDASWFYFVHSFYAHPSETRHTAGEADYGGRFAAAIARDNIFATQFHPEKSAAQGLPCTGISCTGTPDFLLLTSLSTASCPTDMILIPAIDLKDGHCVRLKQGDMDQSTTFGEDPAAMALKWVEQGARRLHLVDLNGAFAGKPQNYAAIKSILKAVGDDIPVQLGGGIRDLDTIEKYIDGGLRYVIIGTAAVKNPGFLKDACTAFGGHIIVGLDARDGKVATDGWSKLTRHEVVDLARKFEDWGVESIIYTDIGRDGMLSGINVEATVRLAQALSIPVIASGGLSNMTDIEQLCAVESEGVEGVICGRAIYSGDLDFAVAQRRADELNG